MSISSITSPTALLSQVASGNLLAAAASQGASSFASTLMQALQAHGHHHGHHGSGALTALPQGAQNLTAAAARAPGRLLNTLA